MKLRLRALACAVLASRRAMPAAAKYVRGDDGGKGGAGGARRSLEEGHDNNKRNRQHRAPPAAVLDQDLALEIAADDAKGYLRNPRIIGGRPAREGQFPFIASLQDRIGHFCGGSLISEDAVLTAAHCLGGSYDVVLGKTNLNGGGGQEVPVDREIEHPGYDRSTTDNDFAVLILEKPVDTSKGKKVEVVTLNREGSAPRVGDDVQVAGWGSTRARLSSKLMEVTVEVISNRDCGDSEGFIGGFFDSYDGQITGNMLCAKESGKDSCQGDSGGPLVTATNDGAPTQVGVVSWGIGCAHRDFPGVYARVSEAYDWIEETVCKYSKRPADSFDCRGGGSNGNDDNDDGGNDDDGGGGNDDDDGGGNDDGDGGGNDDDGTNDDNDGIWEWGSNNDDYDDSPSDNDDGGNDDYSWGSWDWDRDDDSDDFTPAPVPVPSSGEGGWETIFEEDFLDGYGRFGHGSGAKHYSEAKDRTGVVSVQNFGEKNSVHADSIKVGPYSRCRASLDFLFLHMEEDDEFIAEVRRDEGDYSSERVFRGYPHKQWNDGEEVEFRVDGAKTVSFRLRCNGDSRKDDVLISAVNVRCKR